MSWIRVLCGLLTSNSSLYGYVIGYPITGFEAGCKNCYYAQAIKDNFENININKIGEKEITGITDTNVQEVLEGLNKYIKDNTNYYEETYGVSLVKWIIGENGYPVLDLKYE